MADLSRVTDCHVHTKYCCHAGGEPVEYVETAIARGLGGIGFSMHLPADTPAPERWNLLHDEMNLVIRTLDDLRTRYRGDITILIAGEADYFPNAEEEIGRMIQRYPLDYVIGSVHYLDDWPMDHPDYIEGFDRMGVASVYREYFDRVKQAARSGLFDIIGHPDIVKKFGHRPAEDWTPLAEEVAETVGRSNLCIDLNTAGRDKPVGDFYPSRDLIARFVAHGAGIVLGSDAHAPEDVGRYFEEAIGLITDLGVKTLAGFRGRKRTETAL